MANEALSSMFKARDVIHNEIEEGRRFDRLYFSLLVFGCLIALLGLLINSPAVIIGAMLISPLMGPILACGLAFSSADLVLAKRAGRNVLLSIVETIAIAALVTWVSPLRDLTPEIVARTNPNLMDLLIALFSGFAGTLALAARRANLTIVPGVAIATAVMPPLATTGFGIATHRWDIVRGSFMLFATNFMAIVLSAGVVFLVIGFRPQARAHTGFVRWRVPLAVVILCLLSIPLVRTLLSAAEQTRLRHEVHSSLEKVVNDGRSRRLDDIAVHVQQRAIDVNASVQTATYIGSDEIEKWEQQLARKVGRDIHLDVTQLQLAANRPEVTRSADYVGAGVVRQPAPVKEESVAQRAAKVEEDITRAVVPLASAAGLEHTSLDSFANVDHNLHVTVSAISESEVAPATAAVIARSLVGQVHTGVRLTLKVAAPQPIATVEFNGGSEALDRMQSRRLLAAWNREKGADTQLVFVASRTSAPDLNQRRYAALAQVLGIAAAQVFAAPLPSADAPNKVAVYLIRTVTASAGDDGETPPQTSGTLSAATSKQHG